MAREFGVSRENLWLANFFGLDPEGRPRFGAAVGNPPFIRYQRFFGDARRLALARCAAQGIRLPELCSSWAPFLVHSAAMLRPGGRLAMVVPMELAHAAYARRPVARPPVFSEWPPMSLLDAVIVAGRVPARTTGRHDKKRYSEVLSRNLALEVAKGLREVGFQGVTAVQGGPGEKAFQGGLGPKKVDVSYADERHGLLLAVSIKTITSPPFGKNLKNRFYDLCPEAITLHMRFPYSVVCALFCFPVAANEDRTPGRRLSTFARARNLLATISGRQEYTDPGEKFENITMLLFQPVVDGGPAPWIRLIDSVSQREVAESEYFRTLRDIYNRRNPHAALEEGIEDEGEES